MDSATSAAAFVDGSTVAVDCGSWGDVELAANIPTAEFCGAVTEQPVAVESVHVGTNAAGHAWGNTVG